MRKRLKSSKPPKKVNCEICLEDNKAVLHYHHIIERTEPDCTDSWANVCIICANCHNLVHSDQIKIIGVFPSTQKPYGRTLVYEVDGKSNLPGVTKPYYEPKPASMKVFYEDKTSDT